MKKVLVLLLIFGYQIIAAQTGDPRNFPYAKDGLWGLVDKEQNVVLKPMYSEIELPSWMKRGEERDYVLAAGKGSHWGLISNEGKELIPFEYEKIIPSWRNGKMVVAKKDQKYFLIDYQTGRVINSIGYETAPEFFGYNLPVAIVQQHSNFGVVNGKGDIIAEPVYKFAEVLDKYSDFPDIKLKNQDGSIKYIDSWGEEKSLAEMEEVFEEMMWGDTMIEEVAESMEDKLSHTTEQVEIDGKPSFLVRISYVPGYRQARKEKIDTLLNVEEIQSIDLYTSYETKLPEINYAICKREGKLGIVNADQEILCPFKYDRIKDSKEHFVPTYLYNGPLIGIATGSGRLIADALFLSVKKVDKTELFFVKHPAGYEGYVNTGGTIYLPLKDL